MTLRMKHFSFSPVDPDQRMPGPSFAGNPNLAGEKPGTWEVWLPQEMGRDISCGHNVVLVR
jgi:hypothetical protein